MGGYFLDVFASWSELALAMTKSKTNQKSMMITDRL
jgi:hypothetical protein